MESLGLYIHIPFCKKKCGYCSFNSGVDFSVCKNYFDALYLEIINFSKENDRVVDSIFIGGGTPTCVDAKYIEKLLKTVYDNFKLENPEITIECNPESLTADKIESYLKSGINRFSLGVQSLNDNLLNVIGRVHDSKTALNALKLLKNFDISNINCDIMLNLPGQKLNDVFTAVDGLLKFEITHLSAYSLSLEENTPMYNKFQSDEDKAADFYERLVEYLKQFDLYRYEVSNFSKQGFECRHNLKYWRRRDY
jgi:oxygen-independent coproporphyrinogen-3 oxidase